MRGEIGDRTNEGRKSCFWVAFACLVIRVFLEVGETLEEMGVRIGDGNEDVVLDIETDENEVRDGIEYGVVDLEDCINGGRKSDFAERGNEE